MSIVNAAYSGALTADVNATSLNHQNITSGISSTLGLGNSSALFAYTDTPNGITSHLSGGASSAYIDWNDSVNNLAASIIATNTGIVSAFTDGNVSYNVQNTLSPSVAQLQYSDITNSRTSTISLASTSASLGWTDGTLSGGLSITGGSTGIYFQDSGLTTYSFVGLNNTYALLSFENQTSFIDTGFLANDRVATMGITNAAGNNTTWIVDDNAQTYTANKLGGSGNGYVTVDNDGIMGFNLAANQFVGNGQVAYGDFTTGAVTSNSHYIYNTDVSLFHLEFSGANTNYIEYDEPNFKFTVATQDGSANQDKLVIDANLGSTKINHFDAGSSTLTELGVLNNNIYIGATQGGNNTFIGLQLGAISIQSGLMIFTVDEANKKYTFSNNQAGVLSPINIPNIPIYANRTAALAGTLVAGDIYQLPIVADNQILAVV